jgi:hypothetical protein
MVVDSCLNEARDKAVALDYLEQLGIDVASQVKLIVVTHWHDDHIRGISQLLGVARSARFACSAALNNEEFMTLVGLRDEVLQVEHSSGVSEFADVLEILEQRAPGRYLVGPDHWASENKLLYSEGIPPQVEVWALSPSDHTITSTKAQLASMIPTSGEPIRGFPRLSPNDLSVVLLVKTNEMHLLLGGDLERGQDERRGWRALVRSTVGPKVLSCAYKVAHHGSDNADLEEIWTELVLKNGRAILTPYAGGAKPRPAKEDVRRIKSKTAYAYCTIWPPAKKPPRRSVDRTMKEIALSRRAVSKRAGQVRLRIGHDCDLTECRVELFAGAKRL